MTLSVTGCVALNNLITVNNGKEAIMDSCKVSILAFGGTERKLFMSHQHSQHSGQDLNQASLKYKSQDFSFQITYFFISSNSTSGSIKYAIIMTICFLAY
jgi:hypothetical protein